MTAVNIIVHEKDKKEPSLPISTYHALELKDFVIIEAGMVSGKTSVAFHAVDRKGRHFMIETSGDLFKGMAAALAGAEERFCNKTPAVGPAGQKDTTDKPAVGDDRLLVGLPKDLDEAVDTFIDFFRNDPDFGSIVEMTEEKFRVHTHHAGGQFIRNNWYLWWYQGHPYETWPLSKPAIIQHFNDMGIVHADDISSIIIASAFRKVNNLPRDIEGQIKYYQDHWRMQGYPDGIPKMK